MKTVNIHEAKTQLSRLIAEVQKGEEVVIAKAGKPIAKLVAYERPQRKPGNAKGLVNLTDAFFEPHPPEELDAWQQ
jgi:prevent-host-death family protein